MKILKAAPLLLLSLAFTQNSPAQTNTNLFPVTFRAVCASTNSGGIFREAVLNTNLITDCAVDHNVTNLDTLRLVYNLTNNSIQVVGTNGVALCTSFAFTSGLVFTNTNNTHVVFQYNVVVGTNLSSSGVISGAASWNNTNLATSFGIRAELFYIEPAVGTNAPSICHGFLLVGAAINEEEENEGHSHGRGHGREDNPGNHYGWQNPHNPHSRR